MQLLSQQGHLTQEHSKTISIHHFEVPEGVATLGLRFDYGPRVGTNRATNQRLLDEAFDIFIARRKEQLGDEGVSGVRTTLGIDGRVEGLNNLLNVVLIDPAGQWRGRWDRSPVGESEGTLLLSQKVASRGFLPGAITPGRWTAAIECHGVYGDPVEYEIEVDARAPLSPEAEERLSIPAPKTTTRQKRTGPGWYFGEMHSHTRHSDGKWEVEELAEAVSERGSDFLCLTDHNTMSGHEIERDLPVTMIRGCELTTFHGHHPVYGLQDMVPWHEEGKVLPLGETAPRVRAQNGLVSIAHPFVPGDPICTGCRMRDGLDPKDFDMMEIWYRRWDSPGADNVAAYELWNQYWRDGHRILGV
ncbi:MAG: CehA/McbA family metallohydrolase [Myxococcales bacterium]|nr:CehA/McbA family metallohydrolase [Myxococcales bacterium]